MKLRTEIHLGASDCSIEYGQLIYLTGSCFSDNISAKFKHHGFQTSCNSHGVIYNPVSILESLNDVIFQRQYGTSDLMYIGQQFLSLNHHGSFDSENEITALSKINNNIREHHDFLKKASFIFITLGTAWVYEWTGSSKVVANCHKIPAENFKKRLLTMEEVHQALASILSLVRAFNPKAEIIFTLSPVKHLRDGFVENQRSKSILHAAIQEIINGSVSYFPAFEIMNDDLRDYRFWSKDMMHPNDLGIDYIWEKLLDVYMKPSTLSIMKEVNSLQQFLGHRSHHPDELNTAQLEMEKKNKVASLKIKYPQIHL